MNKYLAALSATTLISLAPYALASSVDLTVTGLITPSACTPSLSNGGVIDNGKIPAATLNKTTYTEVGRHPMQLTVTCEAARSIIFKAIDNHPGTTPFGSFGLGLTSKDEMLGSFVTNISNTFADGVLVDPIYSVDEGTSWSSTRVIEPEDLVSVASRSDPGTPIAAMDLSMELVIATFIAPADSLTLNEEITINGSATIEMKYL